MQAVWSTTVGVPPAVFAGIRRQAIFGCCKWDPQVEDVATLSAFPLVLKAAAWQELALRAEALAAETLAVEEALLRTPALHGVLALPRGFRRALHHSPTPSPAWPELRVMRFDFHLTPRGWCISEANTDVPGGFNEASGFTALMAAHYPGARPCGDPALRLADLIQERTCGGAAVALVHATAYTDDRQVMVFLARLLQQRGIRPVLVGPDHLRWQDGRAGVLSEWFQGPVDFIFRFYPGEWLPHLPREKEWRNLLGQGRTPQLNPATALLTQSKRLPLVWHKLGVDLPTWRALLPETCDPRDVDWRQGNGWVVKPALGRVGDGVGVPGATSEGDWKAIRREARWFPWHWVAQRRFDPVPLQTEAGPVYPCLGVYTISGRACGVYGRVCSVPLIDHRAQEIAVLVE